MELKKYITLNRKSEWQKGFRYNLKIDEHKLKYSSSLEENSLVVKKSCFISASIDSTNLDYRWTKVIIDAKLPPNAILKVSWFASNSKEVFIEERLVSLDQYIKSLNTSSAVQTEELSKLQKLFDKEKTGTEILIDAVGRYLWLKIECFFNRDTQFVLNKIKVSMLEEHIIDYLPQLYRDSLMQDDFLARFMMLFEDVFFSIETNIDQLADRLDYTITDKTMLDFLAKWLCITDSNNYDAQTLRQMIDNIGAEYSLIGTKKGLEMFIEREIGITPRIIEYFELKDLITRGENIELYQRLFTENPYKFFILLPHTIFSQGIDMRRFVKKLKANIPAYSEVEIVPLKEGIILDEHTYIGVNTALNEYNHAAMDRGNMISYDTVIGGDNYAE